MTLYCFGRPDTTTGQSFQRDCAACDLAFDYCGLNRTKCLGLESQTLFWHSSTDSGSSLPARYRLHRSPSRLSWHPSLHLQRNCFLIKTTICSTWSDSLSSFCYNRSFFLHRTMTHACLILSRWLRSLQETGLDTDSPFCPFRRRWQLVSIQLDWASKGRTLWSSSSFLCTVLGYPPLWAGR